MLLASPNPPLFVLSAIGQLLAVADMRIESKTHMDESIRVLQEAAGSCEKIITTPIPLSYTRCVVCCCDGVVLTGAGLWKRQQELKSKEVAARCCQDADCGCGRL
jgi:hypothetical protein